MIKSIILENFFSFKEETKIDLNLETNVLVGINGCGKSNFLKAIRLLTESINGEGFEKIFLKDWSGFNGASNFASNKDYIKLTYEFDYEKIGNILQHKGYSFRQNPIYEITIQKIGETNYYLSEKISVDSGNDKGPFILLDVKNAKGFISTSIANKVKLIHYTHEENELGLKSTELVLKQILDPNQFLPLFTLRNVIEKISCYDYFDTTLKSNIRQYNSYGTETKLLANGTNLVIILNKIKNNSILAFDKIETEIRAINPNFKDVSFEILGSKLLLLLREKHLNKAISIEHISDGTLRFLLLLSILYNPEKGSVITIDEPEIGLHPDMINTLAKAIKNAALTSQVVLATHSPLLLNAFELDEVIIFEKDNMNQSKGFSKNENDLEDFNENSMLGQFWLNGELGGKRW